MFLAQYVSTPAALLAVPEAGTPKLLIKPAAPPLACNTLPSTLVAVLAKLGAAAVVAAALVVEDAAWVGWVTQPVVANAAAAITPAKKM